MLVTEETRGLVFRGNMRWLVSCKHLAKSKRAVNESEHELNVRERMEGFQASGFLGFYSTLASSGFNARLRQLLKENKITAYYIFDHKLIENHLVTAGFSDLMFRYFPESYRRIKPLHNVTREYIPLPCDHCGKDLLEEMFRGDYGANYIQVYSQKVPDRTIASVYVACKGECDHALQKQAASDGFTTGWEDLSDLTIPQEFLKTMFGTMNGIKAGEAVYADSAYAKKKRILIAISQKAMRFTTAAERERLETLEEYRY